MLVLLYIKVATNRIRPETPWKRYTTLLGQWHSQGQGAMTFPPITENVDVEER